MGDIDRLEKMVKFKIALSKIEDEIYYKREEDKLMNLFKKIGMIACACSVITTSIVFAKDIKNIIKKIFNNSSIAVDSSVEHGYIQKGEEKYQYDENIGIKIDNLVLDDLNLDISYSIKINKKDVKSARLKDFTITNSNEKTIYRSEFKYAETLDELPLYNSVSWINLPVKIDDVTFSDSLLIGLRPKYEKFSYLYFDISSIQIIYENGTQEILEGKWQLDIEISEEMMKDTSITYNMIDKNEYIESCVATMSNTGTIIELTSKAKIPVSPNINLQETIFLSSENATYSSGFLDYNEKLMTIHFENVGCFIENTDKLELNLGFFNTVIVLEKEDKK